MRRFGIGMMILGIMMIAGAAGMMTCNRTEEIRAERSVREVMVQIESAVKAPSLETPEREMPAYRIDGDDYIGCLTIPALELELPVMAQWSYDRLKIAPCRYTGDLYRNDLVVMAHNYSSHFGKLNRLKPGDRVEFTDMEGLTVAFQVAAVEILESGAVEEMRAGVYDLTLFTCTYGGKKRVTVRCKRS